MVNFYSITVYFIVHSNLLHSCSNFQELVYQQGNYECSLKTMQADLELANSQVTALQQQIDYLGNKPFLNVNVARHV